MGRYSLLVVLALIFTTGFFLVGMDKNQSMALEETIQAMNRRQAQNLANSHARAVLNDLFILEENEGNFDPNDKKFNYNKDLGYVDNGKIDINVDDASTDNTLLVGQYKITAKGTVDSEDAITTVFYDRKAYSYYGLFINDFPNGYYTDGEVLRGPIFSNGHFSVGGNVGPKVEGSISCAGSLKKYSSGVKNWDTSSYFTGDNIHEGVTEIPFKTSESWISNSAENSANIDSDFSKLSTNSPLYIVLLDDGSIAVSDRAILASDVKLNSTKNPSQTKIYSAKELEKVGNVLSSKKHTLRIQGTLSGKLTITTRKNVYIDGDVKYKDDPRVSGNEDSEDLLAIMSKGDQILSTSRITYSNAYGKKSYVYPNQNNVEVMACMYTEGSIYPQSKDYDRGYWKTFGSRVQNKLSTTLSTSYNRRTRKYELKGFREDIEYDERLREQRPPEMPWTNKRRITSWTESY